MRTAMKREIKPEFKTLRALAKASWEHCKGQKSGRAEARREMLRLLERPELYEALALPILSQACECELTKVLASERVQIERDAGRPRDVTVLGGGKLVSARRNIMDAPLIGNRGVLVKNAKEADLVKAADHCDGLSERFRRALTGRASFYRALAAQLPNPHKAVGAVLKQADVEELFRETKAEVKKLSAMSSE